MSLRYFLAVLSALFLLLWLCACGAQPSKVTAMPAVSLPTQTPTFVPTLLASASPTAAPPAQPASVITPTPAPTLTPSPRPTVGRLDSEENGVFQASPGEATQQVLKPATRAIGQGDEMWTDQQGRALLTFADLIVRIYRDSRLQALDVTPAGMKLALGQGAVLVSRAPQAREQVVLVGDPPRARIVVTGTVPVQPQASMVTTGTLTPSPPTTGAGQQVNAVYFVASQPSAGGGGMTVVRPVQGAIQLSAVSGTSTVSQSILVQSPMWALVPPVGASGSAPSPRAATFAELKDLVRDESYWSLIRDIEFDAACLSAARLPLTSEQGQGVSCPLPSLEVTGYSVSCTNPILRATLRWRAAPGCPGVQLSCVAWEWDDGTSSVAQASPATHDFASAGTYGVTGKAYDSLGQTVSKQVSLTVRCPTPSPTPTRPPATRAPVPVGTPIPPPPPPK